MRTQKSYPRYKDSGIEWLGQIPTGWEGLRLKQVASINDQALPEDTDPGWEISYIEIGNVDATRGILEKEEYRFENAPSRARRIVRDGDVIVSTVRTYLRAIAPIVNPEPNLIVSTGFAVIRPRPNLDSSFASYLLHAPYFVERVIAESVGVSYPAINAWQLGTFRVALPSEDEQQAIADFLDRETAKSDALVEKKERLIELLQEKRTALITHAVTKGLDPNVPMKDSGIEWLGKIPAHWEVWKIKHLAQVKRGASPRPIDDPIYFDDEGEYSWVRIADLTASHRYLERTTQRLSKLGQSKSVYLEPGELFVSIAASVGKPIITHIKCCIHDGFVYFKGLRPNAEFVWYLLQCGEAYKGLGKLGTQLNLNTDTVGGISVPLPDSAEQQLLVAFLDHETAKIDALIGKTDEAIKLLKEYRTALISAAVTGKIDVRRQPGEAVS